MVALGAFHKGKWHVFFDSLFVSLLHLISYTVGMMGGTLAAILDQGARKSLDL